MREPTDRIELQVLTTGLDSNDEEAIVQALETDAIESLRAVSTNAPLNLGALQDLSCAK